jgi:hypothetical protein
MSASRRTSSSPACCRSSAASASRSATGRGGLVYVARMAPRSSGFTGSPRCPQAVFDAARLGPRRFFAGRTSAGSRVICDTDHLDHGSASLRRRDPSITGLGSPIRSVAGRPDGPIAHRPLLRFAVGPGHRYEGCPMPECTVRSEDGCDGLSRRESARCASQCLPGVGDHHFQIRRSGPPSQVCLDARDVR